MKGNRSVGAVLLAMSAGLAAGQSVQYRPVVLTGQQAPGFPEGVVFGAFPNYNLDEGNRNLAQFRINNSGQVSFFAPVLTQGPDGPPTVALFGPGAGGTLTKVTMAGEAVPGLAEGLVFSAFETPSLVMNNLGQLAFLSFVADAADPTAPARSGVFGPTEGAEIDLIALEGLTPPGFTEEFVFDFLRSDFSSISDPTATLLQLNDLGQVAFVGRVGSVGDPEFFAGGIFGPLGGSKLTAIAMRGEQVPGLDPGVLYGSFLSPFRLNNAGQVLFAANVFPNTANGVFLDTVLGFTEYSGSINTIFSGDSAPGFNDIPRFIEFEFSGVSPGIMLDLNDAGEPVFTAAVYTPQIEGVADTGIRLQSLYGPTDDGGLGPLVLSGMPAPGFPEPIVFNGSFGFINGSPPNRIRGIPVFSPTIGPSGQVAFVGVVANDSRQREVPFDPWLTEQNNTALYGPLGDSGMNLIVRAGDPVPGFESELAFGPLVLFNLEVVGSIPISVNSRGQVAFFVKLGDRFGSVREGLFMTDLSGRVHPVAIQAGFFNSGTIIDGRVVISISPRFDLNDRGELVFGATFGTLPSLTGGPTRQAAPSSGEGGVFVATVGLGGPGCNLADVSDTPPGSGNYGQLDGNDIGLFVRAFLGGGPLADLSDTPAGSGEFGQFDGGDIGLFVSQFLAGCGSS